MSQHKTIIDAVKTTIETLTGEPTVVIRDDNTLLEEDWTSLPLIILSMGGQRINAAGTEWEGNEYEIFCTIYYAQNWSIQTGLDDALPWRDSIHDKLIPDRTVASGSILSGVAAVYDVDAVDMPVHDARAHANGYEVLMLGLVYRTCEVTHV